MTRPGRIVLVDRGEAYPDRWVTAWHGHGDEGWVGGHYFTNKDDAERSFASRSKKEA